MQTKVTVLIVDDHAIVRQGCRLLFEQAGLEVVGDALCGEDAYAHYLKHKPQVVVMDLTMPGMGGFETIRRIRTQGPEARIVVFTMHDDPIIAARALRAGVHSYVTKTSAPLELVEAVKRAAQGEFYLSREVAQSIALSQLDIHQSPLAHLSTREFDIFRMLAEGRNYAEIAETLSLSQKSVANYAIRIKQKLGAHSLADLIRLAITTGVAKQNVLSLGAGVVT
jgi:two-component system, NarL family, invasion response regulator UvrY